MQPPIDNESWLPVVGYESLYKVSDQGRVRSLDRVVTRKCRWGGVRALTLKGKVLKPQRGNTKGRYLYVCLRNGDSGRMRSVHTLMLEAFTGPCPPGMEGCHFNDIGDDNRLSNLRWDTKIGNSADKIRNGNATNGNTNKSHCKRDHELTPENTYITPSGTRQCRECLRIRARKSYRKKSGIA